MGLFYRIVQLVIISRSLPGSIFLDAFIFLLCFVNGIHLKWVDIVANRRAWIFNRSENLRHGSKSKVQKRKLFDFLKYESCFFMHPSAQPKDPANSEFFELRTLNIKLHTILRF
jgi:hypothetical protein